MIDELTLEKQLEREVPAQRWFGGSAVAGFERVTDLDGTIAQVILTGDDGSRYQVVVGSRDDGVVIDATGDHDLSMALLHRVLPDETVTTVRPLGAEQSNTSLVYDERLVLKLFRRLADGPNPDVEVTRALAQAGFEHVIPPLGVWRDDGGDYAVVNQLLVSATDGWHAAMTSLRDVYDRRCPPDEAAGDFGFEAERLGRVTAQLHVAMGSVFGTHEADVDDWVRDLEAQAARVELPAGLGDRVCDAYRALREVEVGPAIRIHGDLHLGQTLRDDHGWFVLDFEGEPARPLDERRKPSSPMRDVAGMVRSFDYAAQVALRDTGGTEDDELCALAAAWERHNAERFLAGYDGYEDADQVLPSAEVRHVVRRAFELDKAVYEVGYERGHRPDWVDIPLAAVRRILTSVA